MARPATTARRGGSSRSSSTASSSNGNGIVEGASDEVASVTPATSRNGNRNGNRQRDDSASDATALSSYTQRMEESGYALSKKQVMREVSDTVRNKVFPVMKFHGGSSELEFNGRLCRAIMISCGWSGMQESWKRAMWNDAKLVVRRVFKTRKNTCHTAIKKATIGASYVLHVVCLFS